MIVAIMVCEDVITILMCCVSEDKKVQSKIRLKQTLSNVNFIKEIKMGLTKTQYALNRNKEGTNLPLMNSGIYFLHKTLFISFNDACLSFAL